LKEFLERHTREVLNMLMTEWNWEDALAVQREEGWFEGREEGREEGLEEGLAKGLEKGLTKGREEAAAEYTEQIRRLEEEIRLLRGV
jgi:flagellar biosynthesis/type III secretory pathway protein FliH